MCGLLSLSLLLLLMAADDVEESLDDDRMAGSGGRSPAVVPPTSCSLTNVSSVWRKEPSSASGTVMVSVLELCLRDTLALIRRACSADLGRIRS